MCKTGEIFKGNKWSVFLEKFKLRRTFFNFIYAPVYNDEHKVIGVSVVATEVTEHVISEQNF
jgi:two-component system CheB/CheR fusion protein